MSIEELLYKLYDAVATVCEELVGKEWELVASVLGLGGWIG
jgi:hypothetical protein